MSTAIAIDTKESIYNLPDQSGLNFRYPDISTAKSTIKSESGSAFISTSNKHLCAKTPLKSTINLNEPREEIKQKWSGVVVNVDEQNLTVQLQDLMTPENPDEIIVLSRDEIDAKDQSLIQVGSQFYWYIGYRQGTKYSKERFSAIRFRRLPKWTASEVKAAEMLTEEYADFFLTD